MLVHLNGELVEHSRAAVSPFDRGFLFGDALYEGLRAFGHPSDPPDAPPRIIGLGLHAERLARGLAACGLDWDPALLGPLTGALLAANALRDAFVYWQVSRGTPDLSRGPARARVPAAALRPTVFGYATPLPPIDFSPAAAPPVKAAATAPDTRWSLGSIKSTSLLANVLAAIDAHHRHRADEAILLRPTPGGALVSEGTHTNVILAHADPAGPNDAADPLDARALSTPDLTAAPALEGVTLRLLHQAEPRLRARPVHAHELHSAREIILIGTTTMVTSVGVIDGRAVPEAPGPVARALRRRLLSLIAPPHPAQAVPPRLAHA
ncbi:MAG: hypothetical protein C0513_00060 [Isosphaera sp.]|nr:hypothetical protein [Isosphaera sp.]